MALLKPSVRAALRASDSSLIVMQRQRRRSRLLLALFDPSLPASVLRGGAVGEGRGSSPWDTTAFFSPLQVEHVLCVRVCVWSRALVGRVPGLAVLANLWLAFCRTPAPPTPSSVICSPTPLPPPLTGLARRVSIYLDRSKQGGECCRSLLSPPELTCCTEGATRMPPACGLL